MPPVGDEPGVFEIRVCACADPEAALALQEPIARLLCPDPGHAPPCDVPWSFTLDDEQASTVLVVGVYTSLGRATRVAEQVRALVGGGHPVEVREADAERFGELVEQYRLESVPRRD